MFVHNIYVVIFVGTNNALFYIFLMENYLEKNNDTRLCVVNKMFCLHTFYAFHLSCCLP